MLRGLAAAREERANQETLPESADFLCHAGEQCEQLIVKLSTCTSHDFFNPRIVSTYEIRCASPNVGVIKTWKEKYNQS
jgi:hypothetical protein